VVPNDRLSGISASGAVLYEMLTGQHAFQGKSQLTIASAILEKEPESIGKLKPMTPPALDRAIRKCLAKDREERWQTARDLRSELDWIAETGAQTMVGDSRAQRTWQRIALILGALLVLALLAVGTGRFLRSRATVIPIRASLLPPQGASFLPYNFAVSPDGHHLAFVALGADGKTSLWVRVLSGSSAQQLNGTEGASYPFWSPDSRQIGFFADARLKTLDIASGAVQVVCDSLYAWGGSWNNDGIIVFGRSWRGPLYAVGATGGTPAAVTKIARPDSIQAHRCPFFLPDGKHFIYLTQWSGPADPRKDGLYLGSLDGEIGKLLSSDLTGNVMFAAGHFLYVQSRTLMAQPFDIKTFKTTGPPLALTGQELDQRPLFQISGFSVSQNAVVVFQSATDSTTRLVWYDATGKELDQIPQAGYEDPDISPDGRFLAVSSDDERNTRLHLSQRKARKVKSRPTGNGSLTHWPVS
jgi:hypothetical protein